MAGERLTDQAKCSNTEALVGMIGRWRRVLEPTISTETADQVAAGLIDVLMIKTSKVALSPAFEISRQRAMTILEKRPVQKAPIDHHSIPLKHRFFLLYEGLVGPVEVGGLHADGLGLGFGFDRLVDAHRPFLIQHGLGHHMRKGWASSQTRGEAHGLLLQGVCGNQAIEEPPVLALLGRHAAAGEKKLRGPALPNHTREKRTGAHIAAGEANAGEEEGGLRVGCAETEVGGERDHGACTDAHPIHRCDHRLRAGADRLHQIAGHAGKGEQAFHVPLEQRPDDVVDVPAGAEIAAIGRDDHGFDVVSVG